MTTKAERRRKKQATRSRIQRRRFERRKVFERRGAMMARAMQKCFEVWTSLELPELMTLPPVPPGVHKIRKIGFLTAQELVEAAES